MAELNAPPERKQPEHLASCLCLLLLAAACDDTPKTVPFKRPGDDVKTAHAAQTTSTTEVGATTETVVTHPDAPATITLGETTLTLPDHHIHASISRAGGGALLLVADPDGKPSLRSYRAGADGNPSAQQPLSLPLPEGCATDALALSAASPGHLVVEAGLACSASAAQAADSAAAADPLAAPPPAPEGSADLHRRAHFIASLEDNPRLLQRLLIDPAPAHAPGAALSLSLSGEDADDDGHVDLRATLSLTGVGEPLSTTLTWLDRPAGLARDEIEPEKTLHALAKAARKQLRKDPAAAEAAARRVQTLHGLLCRGGEAPMLYVEGGAGLPCGRSEARGHAAATLVAALSAQSRLPDALAALAALQDGPAQRVAPADRERAEAALDAFPSLQGYAIRQGPAVDPVRVPPVHAPRLRFVDEDHLRVETSPLRSVDLRTGEATAMAGSPGGLLASPDGRFAVTEIIRDCEGYRLRILPASAVVAGVAAGRPVSEPLLAPPDTSSGTPCSARPRREAGHHRVLSWDAAGVLVARAAELWRLPLEVDAAPAGPPIRVGAGATPSGSAGADRALPPRLPIPTRLGIALLDTGTGTATLLRIAGDASDVDDVALSPSGKRLAFLRGGQLFWALPETEVPHIEAPDEAPPPGAPPPAPDPGAP